MNNVFDGLRPDEQLRVKEIFAKLDRGEKLTSSEKPFAAKVLRMLKLQRELALSGDGRAKFCPHGGQEEFINAVGSGKYFIMGAFCGNGWGKTACFINILGAIIWGGVPFLANSGRDRKDEYFREDRAQNWMSKWGEAPKTWYKEPLYEEWPYPKRCRIVSDPSNLDDGGAIQTEIDKWWPAKRFTSRKGKYPYRSQITTDTGWKITLMTYEQKVKEFESETVGLVYFDEPPPHVIYKANIARLRKGGMILIGMTALFGSAFLYDEIIESDDPKKYYRYGDVEENCFEHGIRGTLTHEHIQNMIDEYDPEEREARKCGTFVSLSGRIHKDFNRDVHIYVPNHNETKIATRDFILSNKKFFQFYQVVDPHDRKWDAVGYYAMDSNLRKYVIAEYPDRSQAPYHQLKGRPTGSDYEAMIRERLIPLEESMGLGNSNLTRIMDKRFAGYQMVRGGRDGETVVEVWSRVYNTGFITSVSDEFAACRHKLDAHLRIADDGFPMLIFFDGWSDNHIYAIEHWLWDNWEGKTQEKRDWKETPQEKNSDFPRCLHYLCMYDPVWENPSPEIIGWRARLRGHKPGRRGKTWMAA